TDAEITAFQPQIPDWQLSERDGIKRLERLYKFSNFAEALTFTSKRGELRERYGINRLERLYKFSNFAEALTFTNKVGELAEAEAHHPALLTEWGRVTVAWWTHKIRGLHRNDFIMAAKT